ncbi:MAG: hypothetical protein IT162_11130 [Bryobacterales bacterium]|nr:hypothetical protein [Bryobacterales bacterium]
MKRTLLTLMLGAGLLAGADFSYVEKSEVTGGAMKRMMGFMSRFAKGMNGPITTTHAYSGSKHATVSDKTREIWDANAETITHVNVEGKEYSVITFAEMAELAAAMAEQMSKATNPGQAPVDPNVKWKASFEKNGQTKTVAGATAQGGTLKMEMEGTDQKTGQTGAMKMDIEMWMGKVPGWEVKRAFDQRVGEKFAAQAGPQMMALAQAGPAAMSAMQEAGKKINELGEMQLASVTRMYSNSVPNVPEGSGNEGPGVGQAVKDEAAREAENEALRRSTGRLGGLGGRLGGRLGGLSRRPKEESKPAVEKPAEAAAAGPGVLMEMTSEVISYSSAAEAELFAVPAGFKQVEHPMKKAWGKRK